MLQAARADGVPSDPLPVPEDRLAADEVDVGQGEFAKAHVMAGASASAQSAGRSDDRCHCMTQSFAAGRKR